MDVVTGIGEPKNPDCSARRTRNLAAPPALRKRRPSGPGRRNGQGPEKVTPNPRGTLTYLVGAGTGSGLLRLSSLVDLIEIEVGEDVGAMPQSILLLVFLQVGRGCVGIAPASLDHVFIPHVNLDL